MLQTISLSNLPIGKIVSLKNKDWLKKQKYAGKILGNLHKELFLIIKGLATNISLSDLDRFSFDYIKNHNCIPTFLNYYGFPSSICASINKELVHGFGNRKIILKPGDVIKIDIGVTFEEAIADCAVTYIYGKPKSDNILNLLLSCQNALNQSIKVVKPGNRIGAIGSEIYRIGKENNFGVITNYGGHGIDYNTLHAAPFIPNKSKSEDGIIIQPGLSIAIEPMFVLNNNINTKVLSDKWTVVTQDIGAHFEHSITLDEEGNIHIITEHGISVKDFR